MTIHRIIIIITGSGLPGPRRSLKVSIPTSGMSATAPGRVDFEKVGKTWSGPVHAGFTSFQKYVALTGAAPKTALNEEWDVRVYNLGSAQALISYSISSPRRSARQRAR